MPTIHSILYLSFHLNQNKSLRKIYKYIRDDLILTCIFSIDIVVIKVKHFLNLQDRAQFLFDPENGKINKEIPFSLSQFVKTKKEIRNSKD